MRPRGRDVVMGMDFDDGATVFVGRSADRIGSKYKKAIFVEYTDATFKERKPRPAAWQHLGILGPIIHAQVGDKIRVVFHNKASRPYSIHPHGVFYTKANEGALTDDGTSQAERAGGAVAPESTHVYQWDAPARAGPGPSCRLSARGQYGARRRNHCDGGWRRQGGWLACRGGSGICHAVQHF